MALKDVLSKTNNWLKSHKLRNLREYRPELNEQGLISEEQSAEPRPEAVEPEGSRILVIGILVIGDCFGFRIKHFLQPCVRFIRAALSRKLLHIL